MPFRPPSPGPARPITALGGTAPCPFPRPLRVWLIENSGGTGPGAAEGAPCRCRAREELSRPWAVVELQPSLKQGGHSWVWSRAGLVHPRELS